MRIEISSSEPLPELVGIPWGSDKDVAGEHLTQQGAVEIGEQELSHHENLVFSGGTFASKDVQTWLLQFSKDGLHTAKVVMAPPAALLRSEYLDLVERLSREYGQPVRASQPEKKLYTFGKAGKVEGSILCQITPERQILVTYQHQELNLRAMSSMTGLDRPTGPTQASQNGCFIATAVYRQADHPSVVLLQCYRDQVLLRHSLGRAFVRLYYWIGPQLARMTAANPIARAASMWLIVYPSLRIARRRLILRRGTASGSRSE